MAARRWPTPAGSSYGVQRNVTLTSRKAINCSQTVSITRDLHKCSTLMLYKVRSTFQPCSERVECCASVIFWNFGKEMRLLQFCTFETQRYAMIVVKWKRIPNTEDYRQIPYKPEATNFEWCKTFYVFSKLQDVKK